MPAHPQVVGVAEALKVDAEGIPKAAQGGAVVGADEEGQLLRSVVEQALAPAEGQPVAARQRLDRDLLAEAFGELVGVAGGPPRGDPGRGDQHRAALAANRRAFDHSRPL